MLTLLENQANGGEPLHLVKDHLTVRRADGFHLLDTGIPASIAAPAIVSEQLGIQVRRLIGNADLAKQPFRVDWPRRRITFGASPSALAERIPLTMSNLDVPLIDVEVGGEQVSAVFDTGAPLAYAPPRAVRNLAPVREVCDFLPMFGTFTTQVFALPVCVGSRSYRIECGVLPDLLQLALGLLAPDGWIVGTALLKDRVTVIDLVRGALWFES